MKPTHFLACRHNNATHISVLLLCLITVLLGSCAPAFFYGHADRLVLWKLDEYVDLTSNQKVFVRARLRELLAQHRNDALPRYERFLIEIKEKFTNGLDRQEVDWIFSTYQHLRVDLFGRIVADGGTVLSSLSDQQVRYLQTRLQRDHEKVIHRLQEDSESRRSTRASTTVDWLKDWLGTLTKAQQLRIKELSMALPDITASWTDYQRLRQQKLIQVLQYKRDARVLSRYLENWLVYSERRLSAEYQYALDLMQASVKDMVLAIDSLITIQQRAHALTKLQQLIDEVHALSAS
jgi:hypothetical protein